MYLPEGVHGWLRFYRPKKDHPLQICIHDEPCTDYGRRNSFNAAKYWRHLLHYIAYGSNSLEGSIGKSVLAELITYELLRELFPFQNYQQLFLTPTELDSSMKDSRGCDILLAAEYKTYTGGTYFINGCYVQLPLIGFDVTMSSNIDKKRERIPYNETLYIPVLVLPVGKITCFSEYLELVRALLASGSKINSLLPNLNDQNKRTMLKELIEIIAHEVDRISRAIKSGKYTDISGKESILKKLEDFKNGPLRIAYIKYFK